MIVRAGAMCCTFLMICVHWTNPALAQNTCMNFLSFGACADLFVGALACQSNNPNCNHEHEVGGETAGVGTLLNAPYIDSVTNPVPGYKTVAGNGTVTPGTFTSFVKATRKAYPGTAVPAPVDDGPSIVVLMRSVAHFTSHSMLGILYPVFLDLRGSITQMNIPSNGSGPSALITALALQNRKGSSIDLNTTTPCPTTSTTTSPTNCQMSERLTIGYYGDGFVINAEPEQIFELGNDDVFAEWDVLALNGYELTIVTDFDLQASPKTSSDAEAATADFSGTGHMFIESPDPSDPLVADNGHDYSDPARRKAVLTVKSQGPPASGSAEVVADPKYKIVGGGVELPAGRPVG